MQASNAKLIHQAANPQPASASTGAYNYSRTAPAAVDDFPTLGGGASSSGAGAFAAARSNHLPTRYSRPVSGSVDDFPGLPVAAPVHISLFRCLCFSSSACLASLSPDLCRCVTFLITEFSSHHPSPRRTRETPPPVSQQPPEPSLNTLPLTTLRHTASPPKHPPPASRLRTSRL
jgi:hypothetical protein